MDLASIKGGRSQRRHRRWSGRKRKKGGEVIAIDSSDDSDGDDDDPRDEAIVLDDDDDGGADRLDDRKPAARRRKDPPPDAATGGGGMPPCIDLRGSSDEENVSSSSRNDDDGRRRRRHRRSHGGRIGEAAAAAKSGRVWGNRFHHPAAASTDEAAADEAADRALARRLQADEEREARKSKRKAASRGRREEKEMARSTDGKAVLAVQEVMALVDRAKRRYGLPTSSADDPNDGARNRGNGGDIRIEAVTIDDMVHFAKNMLELQRDFVARSVNSHIDTGYHYTTSRNMKDIRTHGLMTAAERNASSVSAVPRGAAFGDGIYTANNGTSFRAFGDVGLIVGRLQGNAVRVGYGHHCLGGANVGPDVNTVVGDKRSNDRWPADDRQHEVVLRSSRQCLPMVRFDASMRDTARGRECVRYVRGELRSMLDRLFNADGATGADANALPFLNATSRGRGGTMPRMPLPLPFPMPPPAAAAASGAALRALLQNAFSSNGGGVGPPANPPAAASAAATLVMRQRAASRHALIAANPLPAIGTGSQMAPPPGRGAPRPSGAEVLTYVAPQTLGTGVPSEAIAAPSKTCHMAEECSICFEPFRKRRKCAALRACQHVFHKTCLEQAFRAKPQCPVCRVLIGEPQGKSPSGTMSVSTSSIKCSGFHHNSIIISYSIRGSVQLSYHDNPGTRQSGKHATAYLPNNSAGRSLCKRLKYAFMHGLTFTVGTSMTTGAQNQCTWASIHHKTAPSGGTSAHGFPDPEYFNNCNEELNSLGVPKAQSLDNDGNLRD